jgi:hypothetical protein
LGLRPGERVNLMVMRRLDECADAGKADWSPAT